MGYLSVCLSVCVCVCQLVNISRLERLFILKTHSAGSEGQHDRGISLKLARLQTSSTSRILRLSFVGHFSLCGKTRVRIYIYYRVLVQPLSPVAERRLYREFNNASKQGLSTM